MLDQNQSFQTIILFLDISQQNKNQKDLSIPFQYISDQRALLEFDQHRVFKSTTRKQQFSPTYQMKRKYYVRKTSDVSRLRKKLMINIFKKLQKSFK